MLQTFRGREQPASPFALPPILKLFCATVLGLSVVSTLYCVVMGVDFGMGYPYSWPFYIVKDRFNDFTIYQDKFHLFHQAAFFTTGWKFTYPAPPAIAFKIFYSLGGEHSLALFLTFTAFAFVIPAVLFFLALVRRGLKRLSAATLVAVTLLLSWPMWLLVDRGNIEVVLWVVLCLATWAYSRGRDWTAATLFGVAASFKLFPFVYLALFLTRRKFPKAVWGACVFGLTTLLCLALLGPTVSEAYRGIRDGLEFFRTTYMAHYFSGEQGVDHSILAFIKVIIYTVTPHDSREHLVALALRFYVPATAIVGIVLYFTRIRKLPWINQLLLLSIVSIYFTPFSGDGTLVHLYYSFVPLCFLAMDAWRRGLRIPGLKASMLCLAYLFATESFLILQAKRFEGEFKCIALGILMVCALRYPFGAPPETEEQPTFSHPDARRIPGTEPQPVVVRAA